MDDMSVPTCFNF